MLIFLKIPILPRSIFLRRMSAIHSDTHKHTHNCSSPCPGTDKSPSTARQTRLSSYLLPTGPNIQGHLCPGFQSRRRWLAFWKQGDLGQSELHSGFEASLGHVTSPCLKINTEDKKKKERKRKTINYSCVLSLSLFLRRA